MARIQHIHPASVLASPAPKSHREFRALRQPQEQPRTSKSGDRCQPPRSQSRSPMRATRPDYHTTSVPTQTTPLHMRVNSKHDRSETIMRLEQGGKVSDNRSLISDLDMESLKANPHWHPSRDPTFIPFVPPTEITIITKEPIREEPASAPPANRSSTSVVGGRNPITGADFVLRQSKEYNPAKVEEDHSSFNTSETEDILSDGYGSTETMMQGKSRKGLLRREISNLLLKKVNVFKRTGTPSRGVFRVQSRSGCMV
ncbi:unnamed protein product [Cylindrotheca closterium]|uniref:Uncharacterized protein n=1 Tax=Cylindrotheca closterium TaxID=2856 RepID=A0AAD2JIN5_9STRA|nr:unnamed protein product [Cylindrotheca closterium]